MPKRFIVETDTDCPNADAVRSLLYLGRQNTRAPAELVNIEVFDVTEIQEKNSMADGKPRMTTKQRDKLWEMCGRYNVPFRENDYVLHQKTGAFSQEGWVEGWIGGPLHNGHNNMGKTIYVGVDPEGNANT